MIAAITLAAALGGCANSPPGREPLSRDIGGPPSYLQPVPIPPTRAGESPVVDARRLVGSLRQANGVIVCAREEWTLTRDRMMGVDVSASRCAQGK